MLSALSSFLPSVPSDKLDKFNKLVDLRSDDASRKQQVQDPFVVKPSETAEDANKKEKKKKPSSYETFIVVRPPPAKNNHPLNLQLQLVPPQTTRERSSTLVTTPTKSQFTTDQGQTPDFARPSSTSSNSESDHAVGRSPSIRSNRSDTSGFYASTTSAATGSVTSFASTASTASGRRIIIPLYNLSAHNVMTNTILDAGTDARVAKFHKRGLEIIDLGILEPIEVWAGKDYAHGAGVAALDSLSVPLRRGSGTSSLAPPAQNGSRAGTPDPSQSPGSSHLSISDHEHGIVYQPANDPVITPTATPTGAKKIFGKIFRKRESSGGGGARPSSSVSVSTVSPSQPKMAPNPECRPAVPAKQPPSSEVLLPAVLGLSPTLSAATNPPTGRCVSYVWSIRKWLKVDAEGHTGVLGKIGREASAHGFGHASFPDGGDWDVRFEWVRGKSKGEKARKAARRASLDLGGRNRSHTPSRRDSALIGLEEEVHELHDSNHNHNNNNNYNNNYNNNGLAISIDSPRASLDAKRPRSRGGSPRRDRAPARAVSITSTKDSDESTAAGGHYEAEDESDPEDSETPWTCSMILTHVSTLCGPQSQSSSSSSSLFAKGHSRVRTVSNTGDVGLPTVPGPVAPATIHGRPSTSHGASASASGETGGPASVKIKVATLSPAPHHPKVVCQLKIPFPLPDVEVRRGVVRRRVVLADGTTRSTVPIGLGSGAGTGLDGLTMTAEEIKDVVCSTAFWVVVREGIGGVGKKSRKGDGWRIRG